MIIARSHSRGSPELLLWKDMLQFLILCLLGSSCCHLLPVSESEDVDTIREKQLSVLANFVAELARNAPYVTARSSHNFGSRGCAPCNARRPSPRPKTTVAPLRKELEDIPENLRVVVKERKKIVFVNASSPATETRFSNGTVVLSQPVAHWFEKKYSKGTNSGEIEVVQEAQGQTIYIIDSEREVLYYDKKDELSHHEKKMKMKQDHLESKGWVYKTLAQWRDRHRDNENEECVFLILCLIGVNPNDFGRVGQDIDNLLKGSQTDVLKTLSRYVTALRIGTRASTFNINNPCGTLSSSCMTEVAPTLPFWPFINDNFSA